MSDYIPKNTYNSLKRRVWLAESKSTRNTFWALDDNGFKKALTDTTVKYPLVHYATWRMDVDRRHFTVTVRELPPSGLFGRVFNVNCFSRSGLNGWLSHFLMDSETFPEAMKLTVPERLKKFAYTS